MRRITEILASRSRDQEMLNAQREYARNEARCREERRRQAEFGVTPITGAQGRAA
jgi:hypothetical protein